MEAPLHPTPMQRPMMKGKIYVDASNKPTFQGFWGMTHADVNKSGHTNDFKVVRMESVKEHEVGMPVFAGHYLGYFKLTSGFQTETVNESFTLTFRGHSNHGYNVYGFGENRYGKNEIVGTVTQSGKMEIFKMIPGTTVQPDPNEPPPKLPRPANPRAASPPPPPLKAFAPPRPGTGGGGAAFTPGGGASRSKSGGSSKKKSSSKSKSSAPPPPASKNGLPGVHVRMLKDCLAMLRKSDKNNVFQFPVPPMFRGLKGFYVDVIKRPMDLGTVVTQIDSKYRTAMECVEDVRLVFSNAKEFNPDTDPVHALAASLSGKFEAFLSNHRGALGLDSSGSASGSKASPPPPSSAASMALSASAAASATGKRLGVPPPSVRAVDTSLAGGASGDDEGETVGLKDGRPGPVLTREEQDELAKDVNELFRVGNANPTNERAQARVYALWCFAKAYVEAKDRVLVDGGMGAEIQMNALNHNRQRQLRDVVSFFMEDSKNDPTPAADGQEETAASVSKKNRPGEGRMSDRGDAGGSSSGGPRKRSRSDLSDSENDQEEEYGQSDRISPGKRSRDGSGASAGSKGAMPAEEEEDAGKKDSPAPHSEPAFGRVDSSRLTLEATASNLKETEIDIDLDEEEEDDEDDDDDYDGNGGGDRKAGGEGAGGRAGAAGAMDEQWTQAQAERKEREDRERARAASEKALEEQRLKQQAQREKERVEEGIKLSRERAAEKARVEAAALEKLNREKKELEDKKEAERLAREEVKASVDLDQVRADSKLMDLMDESVYDD